MSDEKKTAGASAPATLEEALARIAELDAALAEEESNHSNSVQLQNDAVLKLGADLKEAQEANDKLKSELEALKASTPEVKEAPAAPGHPKVSIAKGPHKGEYEITAPYVLIPGIVGKVSAEQLAADPAMVEELIKIESGIIRKTK